jgi:hypothetical protein
MQGFLFSRAVAPQDLQTWLEQTVLPRKAAWIGAASDADQVEDSLRASGARPFR